MTYKEAKKQLKEIVNNYSNTDLMREVAKETIYNASDYETIDSYFNDLLSHGCSSGMIGSQIYYSDTHKFAQKYIRDIMELVADTEESMGQPLKMESDRLNWLSWFAYEETSRQIAGKLGLEV